MNSHEVIQLRTMTKYISIFLYRSHLATFVYCIYSHVLDFMNYQIVILAVFVLFAVKEAFYSGLFNKANEERADGFVEIGSSLLLFAVSQATA